MPKRYEPEEKARVMEMVHELGVRETSRRTGVPLGTLSSWRTWARRQGDQVIRPAKSKFTKHWPPRRYNDDFRQQVVDHYKKSRSPHRLKETAQTFDLSTRTVRKWLNLLDS